MDVTDVSGGPRGQRIALSLAAVVAVAGALLGIAAARPALTKQEPTLEGTATAVPSVPELSVTPADGANAVGPNFQVRVNARNGRITAVRVAPVVAGSVGAPVPGALRRAGTVWRATGQLAPRTSYTVIADGVDAAGRPTTTTTTFRTRAPNAREQLHVSRIWPPAGSTVGIAAPLSVVFNHPVTDRVAVQSALHVTVTPPVPGAWYWVDTNTVDYRPQTFWAPGTKVAVSTSLADVPAGGGLWGVGSKSSSFTVGRAQTVRVDLQKHVLTVERAGAVVMQFPVSGGKPGWQTRNGTQLIMAKVRNKTWTNTAIDAPESYVLHSDHAMRLTNSGEFIHDAPWNRGNIGSANTSHGCVGMNLDDMAQLYDASMVGDPVIITGSDRPHGVLWNLFMDWNVPWSQWSRGNATKDAI